MNTNESNRRFEIVNGPSRDLIFDACKYAHSRDVGIKVDLTIAFGYTMPKGTPGSGYLRMAISEILIVGVEHENGSGDDLNIAGYCRANLESIGRDLKPYKFKAHYNSKTRKGTILFENL
ncbi:hypothetical protein IJM16_01075 [Candidatus Saccharibacteria bacterium]|nr:hypothetical protein [Candidatus Saccharibacteria bacterium]